VFVRRVSTGVTRQLSRGLAGAAPDGITGEGTAISGNGFWVAFVSRATNLVPGDISTTQSAKIFVADSCVSASPVPVICPPIALGSVATDGTQPNLGSSVSPDLSFDGSRLVFSSNSNLLTGFGTGTTHIWLRDRLAGTTEIVSVDGAGVPGAGDSVRPRISSDGRFVVFVSSASELVAGDTNGRDDVFLRDTCFNAPAQCTPSTRRVSVGSGGVQQADGVYNGSADLSDDGRYVVFDSDATNFAPSANVPVAYRHDRLTGTTVALCDNVQSCRSPSLSGDGRLASFEQANQVQVRDTCLGATLPCTPNTFIVSRVVGGASADNGGADFARISRDGFKIVFTSNATNLVPGYNGFKHVYRARIMGP
jgi:Tol biopolymer transport system component